MDFHAKGTFARTVAEFASATFPVIVVEIICTEEVVHDKWRQVIPWLPVVVLRAVALPPYEEFSVASSCFTFHSEDFVHYVELSAAAFAGMDPAAVFIVENLPTACVGAYVLCHRFALLRRRPLYSALFADMHKLCLLGVNLHIRIHFRALCNGAYPALCHCNVFIQECRIIGIS